jgi:hypothetical protein
MEIIEIIAIVKAAWELNVVQRLPAFLRHIFGGKKK